MFFELMGTVLAGLAAALLIFAIRRFAPDRLPRWLMPVGAGVAMIAATISSEYGWYDRVSASMPEGFVVAQSVEETAIYRPWTYIAPIRSRFVAVDSGSVRTNATLPDHRIVDLYFFGRWSPVNTVPVLFDCAGNRSAALVQDVEFNADGTVPGASWSNMAADDPVLRTACEVG